MAGADRRASGRTRLAIIDPPHHLWDVPSAFYHAPELVADVLEGHRVLATVFVECKAHFDVPGTSDLASVGETRFAVGQAQTLLPMLACACLLTLVVVRRSCHRECHQPFIAPIASLRKVGKGEMLPPVQFHLGNQVAG